VIHVAINGQPYAHEEATSILTALRRIGVHVPTLRHDDRLKPTGVCRPCLVTVKNWSRPVSACATPLCDGMVIETDTPELEELDRWNSFPGK
jgi:formate dehydrogenase major subunit